MVAHFPPSKTYNSSGSLHDVLESLRSNDSLSSTYRSLLIFGHGDGGGGPAESHLEQLLRVQSLSKATTAIPSVCLDTSIDEFFQDIESVDWSFPSTSVATAAVTATETEEETEEEKRERQIWQQGHRGVRSGFARQVGIQRWIGELYFELHQGTLTSQALVKRYNRYCENMMRSIESLLVAVTFAGDLHLGGDTGSIADLTDILSSIKQMWKTILLNQFHDVIRKLIYVFSCCKNHQIKLIFLLYKKDI